MCTWRSSQSLQQAAGGQGDADPAADVGRYSPQLVGQIIWRHAVRPPSGQRKACKDLSLSATWFLLWLVVVVSEIRST